MEKKMPHFLIVTYHTQSHINPALQFADRLLRAGANVTYVVSTSGDRYLKNSIVPDNLIFAKFSDGYDNSKGSGDSNLTTFRLRGVQTIEELFVKSAAQGKKVTCLLYTICISWAPEVARRFHVPSALVWIQPAMVFNIVYHYHNGYRGVIDDCENDPLWSLELPNLPLKLKAHDLPSCFLPSNHISNNFVLTSLQEHVEELKKEENPMILVNSFEGLEVSAFKAMEDFNLIPIGPLLPSALENNKALTLGKSSCSSKNVNYLEWLDSQEKNSSVIYVSFGSIFVMSKAQMEELAKALIQTHRPFLWVIREKMSNNEVDEKENDHEENELISCMEELNQQGLIVPWCSQLEVLSHPSIGCFVTHCGWNSTLESLTCGVPTVGVPQWMDQMTNAKLMEDLWGIGVRVKAKAKASDEEGWVVNSEEIKRCLDEVMENEELRQNAKKWKDLAIEAAKEGGSSDRNIKAFIEELLNVES